MTTTQILNRKVSRLNTIIAVVREWQRGAITKVERDRRLDLTTDEYAVLDHPWQGVQRTSRPEVIASVVAKIVGL